jgi:homoserine dehydrogenase
MSASVRVALLGCGVVGGATARILVEHADGLAERAGVPIELARVVVRDPDKPRVLDLPPGVITTDALAAVKDPDVDLVVEAVGGMEPARSLLFEAISSGKHVVTANKELMASAAEELMAAAGEAGTDLLFEASVAGGIPIIRPMKESLAGDRVSRVMGIVNGTTNFILTRMSEGGLSFEEALDEADRHGYTEADPSADIDGHDAVAKLAILASIAYDARVAASDVEREGVRNVTADDIVAAHELGYEVKLIAVAEREDGEVAARVHPAMLPKTHPLAAVRNEFNAVFVEAEEAGEIMFYGRGAGGGPTASAVVGDIVEIVRHMAGGSPAPGFTYYRKKARILEPGSAPARYYVVLSVPDQPGVLSAVAGVFARHGVSISSVRQEGAGDEATLMLITHTAPQRAHDETFAELESLQAVKRIHSRMRVLGTAEG